MVVVHTLHPNTKEAEAGGSLKFKAAKAIVRPCLVVIGCSYWHGFLGFYLEHNV